jgi:plasmid stabilization system protein ParE
MKLFWTETALKDLERIYYFRENSTAEDITSAILKDNKKSAFVYMFAGFEINVRIFR